VKVERKLVKTDNQFRELENKDDGADEDKDFMQEIMLEQRAENSNEYKHEMNFAERKVRFEKMPKKKSQTTKKRSQDLEINLVRGESRKSKITIDSGAEESVWPIGQVDEKDLGETEASRNDIGFVAANGARMKNFGALKVEFENKGKPMQMNFHATSVKKPLAAVCRITDCGNKVCFGPRPEDNYILNIETQEQIFMTRERGTYVLEINLKDNNSVFARRVLM
jgi:hypothetical protein